MDENQVTIFNIGENQSAMNSSMFRSNYESTLFDPKLANLQDTDTFIVRPLPYVKNPLNSLVNKGFYALQDELGVFIFDSKTTFNRPAERHYEFCEPSDLWLKLRNSKDPNVSARTNFLRKQQSNYCYVLIVNYPKDPKLNGQIRPFKVPMEMIKAMQQMSNPTDQQRALGAVPIQPFDMFNGKNITCSIVGHMEGTTLMRKWTVTPDQLSSEVSLPLGPNGAMLKVSECKQEDVLNLFNEKMTEDLREVYGYHEPQIDVKSRMKNYLRKIVADIPALVGVVEGYFPELNANAPLDNNAMGNHQPVPQQVEVRTLGGQPAEQAQQPAQPTVQPTQPVPPIQPVQTGVQSEQGHTAQPTQQSTAQSTQPAIGTSAPHAQQAPQNAPQSVMPGIVLP